MKVALLEASHWHVPLYLDALERSGVEVVGVSDREMVKGAAIAQRFGCPLHRSYDDLLQRTPVDFAFAFGRHVDMPRIGHALIDRGIAFAIEKPCGTSADVVAKLRARAEAAKVYAAVPFILRGGDLVRELHKAEGAMPFRLHHASFRFVVGPPSRYVDSGAGWMLDPAQSGGGCMINVGTHFVDLFRLVTGQEVASVSATMHARGHNGAIEDYAAVMMTTGDGTTGLVETGYTFPSDRVEQREFTFTVSSDANYYRSGGDALLVRPRRQDALATARIPIELDTDPLYGVFVERVLSEMQSNAAPVAGLREAEAVMRVLDAAYASARMGGVPQAVR